MKILDKIIELITGRKKIMKDVNKYKFKIKSKDRRTLTKEDYELAKRTLPTLPDGWYREPQEWSAPKY